MSIQCIWNKLELKSILDDSVYQVLNFLSPLGKKLKCPYCERLYGYETNLRAHVRQRHQGIRVHCPFCTRTFTRNNTVRRHIAREHKAQQEAQQLAQRLGGHWGKKWVKDDKWWIYPMRDVGQNSLVENFFGWKFVGWNWRKDRKQQKFRFRPKRAKPDFLWSFSRKRLESGAILKIKRVFDETQYEFLGHTQNPVFLFFSTLQVVLNHLTPKGICYFMVVFTKTSEPILTI